VEISFHIALAPVHGHQAAYPLVDFSARTTALSIASMEDSKDDSVSSVQPAFLLVAKHRIYKCGMHDLCLKIFRWLCIRHKLYNSVHAFS